MKQLAKLQHGFQDCVLNGNQPALPGWISASGRATAETRLSVYTHGYCARLREVLSNDYPAILTAIGDEQFKRITDNYITAHPSRYFNIRDFGTHFPDFIAGSLQQESYTDMQWIYELALFEWTLGEAFAAADVPYFTEQDMAAFPADDWPDMKFKIHPSLYRLDLEWNIIEMWQALTKDKPEHVNARKGSVSPLIVWREQLVTRFRTLQTGERYALDTICKGGSFSDICEALATKMPDAEVPLKAATLLKSWIAQGLISGTR